MTVIMRRDLGKVRLLPLPASSTLGDGKLYVAGYAMADGAVCT